MTVSEYLCRLKDNQSFWGGEKKWKKNMKKKRRWRKICVYKEDNNLAIVSPKKPLCICVCIWEYVYNNVLN